MAFASLAEPTAEEGREEDVLIAGHQHQPLD
jgi:hypothetical protein